MKEIIFLYLVLTGIIYSQDLLKLQYEYAIDLYNDGKYYDAVTEFKRLLFFDSADNYKPEAEFYTGLSYKKGGFYSRAIEHFSSALLQAKDKDKNFKIRVEIIKSNILRGNSLRAIQIINNLRKDNPDSLKNNELDLLEGYAHAFSGRWEMAAESFTKAERNDLADLSYETKNKMFSEMKARLLSVFLPGAGQIYTGNYLNGIVSLAWNVFAGYLTVSSFIDDRIFDGIVIGNFLWLRFYSGNIYNAGNFAKQKNSEINSKALQLLQEDRKYSLH